MMDPMCRTEAESGDPPALVAPLEELLGRLTSNRLAGRALPREAYLDAGLYARDLEQVFSRQWLFAGHACQIPRSGDYFLFELAGESLIVVRDEPGEIRAHANVCRHRGSRMCDSESGRVRSIVCPYHQWTYALNGALRGARWMGDGFDPARYPLRSVPVRNVAGLIFVCLADDPPDLDSAWETISGQIALNQLDRARIACRFDYTIRANWKVVVENNRECYHCRGGHPEFCLSNYDVGVNGDRRENPEFAQGKQRLREVWDRLGGFQEDVNFPGGAGYRVARFPLKKGFLTESLDGRNVAPLMGEVPEPGIGSLRIVTLPNAWIHVNCDYAVTTRIVPVDAETTRARVTFLVDGDAMPGADFDPDAVAAVWKATSEQDWTLCERMQEGIRSRFYEPGPYSPLAENGVAAFVDWYLEQLQGRN